MADNNIQFLIDNIDNPDILLTYVLNYPQVFRYIPEDLIDRVLQYTVDQLDLDCIIYSSINSLTVFEKVLNAIKLTDNLANSEYYEWFISCYKTNNPTIFEMYVQWVNCLKDDDPKKIREIRFICENIIYELSQLEDQSRVELFKQKYAHIL